MSKPWYKEGVRFECTACGDCCRREGDVFFSPEEARRAVKAAYDSEATPEAFVGELWLEEWDGTYRMPVPVGGRCAFLKDDNRCEIHAVKPLQCRTYPFWPEILRGERHWKAEAKWCEGIDRGEPIEAAEVAQRLNEAE